MHIASIGIDLGKTAAVEELPPVIETAWFWHPAARRALGSETRNDVCG